MKLIKFFTELIGWFKIVISPSLLGFAIGVIIYIYKNDTVGLIIAITITSVGFIIGIIWATKVWLKEGTNNFFTRLMASPDLDNIEKEKELEK